MKEVAAFSVDVPMHSNLKWSLAASALTLSGVCVAAYALMGWVAISSSGVASRDQRVWFQTVGGSGLAVATLGAFLLVRAVTRRRPSP